MHRKHCQIEEETEKHSNMFDVTRWKAVRAKATDRRHMHIVWARTSNKPIDERIDEVCNECAHGDRDSRAKMSQYSQNRDNDSHQNRTQRRLIHIAWKQDDGCEDRAAPGT